MEDWYSLSDKQICKRIGSKIKSTRLKRNITQQNLAMSASISLSSLKKIESGEIGTFDSLLRILRTLEMLDALSSLIQEEQLTPIEYYEMINKAKKHNRQRATGHIKVIKETEEW